MALAPAMTPAAPEAAAQGSSSTPDRSAFYTPPAELPTEPGAIIRTEPMTITPSIPDLANGGALLADAQRIMYRSTGAAGSPIAVTGAYLHPQAPWTGPGPRPLAVVTPGTQGQGDQCAPSKSMEVGLGVQTAPPSAAAGYAVIDALTMVQEGFAVVVTDYEGLGTPGHHPYVNRDSQGRSALDAARAALRLPGTDLAPDSKTVVSGYSQGGGAAAAAGVAMHAGQGCAFTTRLLVPRARYDEAVAAAATAMSGIGFGDPTEPATLCGPLISARQRDRVEGYLRLAVDEGGRFACGGGRPADRTRGFFIEPTVVAGLTNDARVAREEIFGPVLTVIAHDGDADAVHIANDSPYGLSGAVVGTDQDRVDWVASRLRTGTINVNGGVWYSPDAPFGGYKQSGIGREMGLAGFEEYLETKLVARGIPGTR